MKLTGVKLTDGECQLLDWLCWSHRLVTHSEMLRHLLHQAGRLNGAPPALRSRAIEERTACPPRRRAVEMIEPDQLQQQVIDISGKDSGK